MKEKLDNVDNENNKNEVVDLFVSHDEDFVGNFVLNLIKNDYDVECTVFFLVRIPLVCFDPDHPAGLIHDKMRMTIVT